MNAAAVIRTKIASLQGERKRLTGRKKEIEGRLRELNISNYAFRKAKTRQIFIDEDKLIEREVLSKELTFIEKRLSEIAVELIHLHRKDDASDTKYIINVLKEIFNEQQFMEIMREAHRRLDGEPPLRVLFNFDKAHSMFDESEKWKGLYARELDKQQEIRIILTRIIDAGCKEFGNEKFMKIISPLNRFVIPVNEINKKKIALNPSNYQLNPRTKSMPRT